LAQELLESPFVINFKDWKRDQSERHRHLAAPLTGRISIEIQLAAVGRFNRFKEVPAYEGQR